MRKVIIPEPKKTEEVIELDTVVSNKFYLGVSPTAIDVAIISNYGDYGRGKYSLANLGQRFTDGNYHISNRPLREIIRIFMEQHGWTFYQFETFLELSEFYVNLKK